MSTSTQVSSNFILSHFPSPSDIRENILMALFRCQISDDDSIPRPTAPRYNDGQRRLRVASINNIVVDDTDAESVVAFARERRRDARRHVIRESRTERNSAAIEPGTLRAGTRRECDLGRSYCSHQLAKNAHSEARRNRVPSRRGPTHDMAKVSPDAKRLHVELLRPIGKIHSRK